MEESDGDGWSDCTGKRHPYNGDVDYKANKPKDYR